ncbi:MAG TPA: GNAT family N-acetyltransferase [Herpetosiphonaceae bacterium]
MQQDQQPIVIRPVRAEDAEAIAQITREAGVIETILALPSDRVAQREQALARLGDDEHYFVAEVAGQVLGLAGLSVGRGRLRHSGHVFLFVSQALHGRGIGTRLMEALLDLADNWLLLRRVELTVFAENERARRLYERLGFVVEGRRKMSVISQGELKDEFLMARYR